MRARLIRRATVGEVMAVMAVLVRLPAPPPRPFVPQLVAPNIISTVDDEVGGNLSPDGTELYFAKVSPYTTFPRFSVICVSMLRNGRWSTPQVLPFSGHYLDYPPRLSPDGQTLYFASSRPVPGAPPALRIWAAHRAGSGWSEPTLLPAPINLPGHGWNWTPSVTRDGTLYFASDRDQPGRPQIYRAERLENGYATPEKLDAAINSAYNDYDPFISPDERILLFVSSGEGGPPFNHRDDTMYGGGFPYARGDLYVSVRQNGAWTPARHLGHGINSEAEESYPALSPDGSTLFFTSERSPFTVPTAHRMDEREMARQLHSILNGHGNLFSISAAALDLEP